MYNGFSCRLEKNNKETVVKRKSIAWWIYRLIERIKMKPLDRTIMKFYEIVRGNKSIQKDMHEDFQKLEFTKDNIIHFMDGDY